MVMNLETEGYNLNNDLFQEYLGSTRGINENFRISLSVSTKKSAGILIKIMLNLQISQGSIAILTMLSLPVHEHRMFFHLFTSSLFLSIMFFLSSVSFVKFNPKNSHFLCYCDFFILILYPTTLLNSFGSSSSYFCESFRVYYI